MVMLDIRNLHKSFGGVEALAGVDLQVAEGEIVSVIGPNGAGKTSFFNVVTGLYPPDSGEILFEGRNIVGLESSQITEAGIARTFQNVRLFLNMTVLENVMVAQHCRTRAGAFRAILRTPFLRREEAEIMARSKEILSFFGPSWSATASTNPLCPFPTPTGGVWRSPGPWRPNPSCSFSTNRWPE